MSKAWITEETYQGEDRRRNGAAKLTWWAMGLLTTIVLSGGSCWLTNIHADVVELQDLSRVRDGETHVLKSQMIDVIRRLERIENKLDRVVETKR